MVSPFRPNYRVYLVNSSLIETVRECFVLVRCQKSARGVIIVIQGRPPFLPSSILRRCIFFFSKTYLVRASIRSSYFKNLFKYDCLLCIPYRGFEANTYCFTFAAVINLGQSSVLPLFLLKVAKSLFLLLSQLVLFTSNKSYT